MRAYSKHVVAFAFAWAVCAPPSSAAADDSAAAQALFDQAKKAMADRRYDEACPKFEESLRLQEALGTLLNLAECFERQGKLASAWSRFLEVSSKARAAGQADRARIGHDRAASLAPRLANIAIDVPSGSRVDGLEVRRDTTVVGSPEWGAPIPADPGTHTISASAPGRKPWSQTITIGDSATTTHVAVPELELAPESPSPPSPPVSPTLGGTPEQAAPRLGGMKIVAIAAAGVGVVGVGVGTAFGILSISKHNAASSACPSNPCHTPDGQNLWADAVTFGNVSTIGFIVGGVGLAAGAVMWVVAPKPAEPNAPVAKLAVGPGTLTLLGAW